MKYATDRPYADPEKAARRLMEIANTIEAIQAGRIPRQKDQPSFPARRCPASRVWRRVEVCDLRGLVPEARVWNLCEVHPAGADLFA